MLHLLKMWLKAPVEETDERGHRRTHGGKKATRGTPQGGVISPLLANIYMHRFVKAFRKYGLDRRYGAVLVTYADDFVVLCRHGAAEVLETTRRWMASIGLALNEDKTRVCNARCESFDFLGYTFGPMYSPRTGGCYLGARPSRKAVASIKDAIRQRLWRGNPAPWEELVRDLNRTVRGWAAYFSYGSCTKARRDVHPTRARPFHDLELMSECEDLKVQADPISKRCAQCQQERNDHRPHVGSLFGDADNINNDNKNRVLGRDTTPHRPRDRHDARVENARGLQRLAFKNAAQRQRTSIGEQRVPVRRCGSTLACVCDCASDEGIVPPEVVVNNYKRERYETIFTTPRHATERIQIVNQPSSR
jgi:hypothetical protein